MTLQDDINERRSKAFARMQVSSDRPVNGTCENCRFFAMRTDYEAGPADGFCVRYAPQGPFADEAGEYFIFSPTNFDVYCGDHRPALMQKKPFCRSLKIVFWQLVVAVTVSLLGDRFFCEPRRPIESSILEDN